MSDDGASLDERKAAILRAVVEEYIETAQPVGSTSVATAAPIKVSSATIRNDMATLEAEGFLLQPHTSAGRIPTDKGYRYFVDSVGTGSLGRPDNRRVADFFKQMRGEIEDLMRDTAGLLSHLTDYAAVVVDHSADAAAVRSFQLVSLSDDTVLAETVLAVVVFANGSIEKHSIDLDTPLDADDLSRVETVVSEALDGAVLSAPATLPPIGAPALDRLAESVLDTVGGVLADPDKVYVDGASRVVSSFDAVDSVSRVLTILEQQLVVVSLMTDVLDRGMSVAIGAETGIEPLEECSVVVSPYAIDGEPAGSIGVLGPTRMNYPQAMAAVAVVSRQLGNRLSEG